MAISDAEENAAPDVDTPDQEHETVEASENEAMLEQDNVQGDAEIPEANQEVKEESEEEKESDTENEDSEKDEEVKEEVEVGKKGTGSKKGSTTKPAARNKGKEPVTSSERPVRARRTTDFYKDPSYGKAPAAKFSVEKGSGTKLNDIPNVAFKLSKRKPDDTLHLLHSLLFGKKGKNQTLKKNIGQFSGYVWAEDEEKQRAKFREKFDKCVKEKLLEFCDVLNISINKSNTRKEDVIDKLLEFLESPHATTETLLAGKDQKAKKGKVTPSKPSPGEASTKKRKRTSEVSEKQKPSSTGEEDSDDKSVSSDVKDDSEKDNDEVEKESETEEDEPPKERKENKKSLSKENVKGASRSKRKSTPVERESASESVKKASTPTSRKRGGGADVTSGSSSKAKGPATKKQKIEKETYEGSAKGPSSKTKGSISKKQNIEKEAKGGSSKGKVKATIKEPSKAPAKQKASAKDKGKGKITKKPKAEPSREEIHAIVADLLKEVDFNTVTLSDVIRQLGTHFGIDLMHRKLEVKEIIADVINNMTDDEDEEGEEAEEKAESEDEEGEEADKKAESGDEEGEEAEEKAESGDEEEAEEKGESGDEEKGDEEKDEGNNDESDSDNDSDS